MPVGKRNVLAMTLAGFPGWPEGLTTRRSRALSTIGLVPYLQATTLTKQSRERTYNESNYYWADAHAPITSSHYHLMASN